MLTVSNAANPGALSHDLLALHPDSVEKDNFDTPIMHPLGVTCILTGLGHADCIRKGVVHRVKRPSEVLVRCCGLAFTCLGGLELAIIRSLGNTGP
jgi:hypothetical protein